MSWENDQKEQVVAPEPKPEAKANAAAATQDNASKDAPANATQDVATKPAENVSSDAAATSTDKTKDEPAAATTDSNKTDSEDQKLVPQKLIGKVAKEIRDKSRGQLAEKDEKIRALLDENRKLKEGGNGAQDRDPAEIEEDQRISVKVRAEFLKQQDAYGRRKYGQDYVDAIQLVAAQNDPALTNRIQWADDPAETLMKEATRIAEEIEYGGDQSKKEQALRAKFRQEWEQELAAKIDARKNQPTDLQSVRAAGGDDKPAFKQETWETSLPK